jgi:DNA gyrase/topoisomerase IV subunit A
MVGSCSRYSEEIAEVVAILRTIRVKAISTEAEIHEAIGQTLRKGGIRFRHEYRILTHKQFDFWIAGIVIEVKKKKPGKVVLLNQLNRYTKVAAVRGIIVVMQESMHLPKSLNGKPVICLSLNANWGLAF